MKTNPSRVAFTFGAAMGACFVALLSVEAPERNRARRRLGPQVGIPEIPAQLEPQLAELETGEGLEARKGERVLEPAALDGLELKVSDQQAELDRLREALKETERRASTAAELLERRVRQLREDLPVLVESSLSAQVADMQARFDADAEETRTTTVATFEAMVEEKLSERISLVEQTLSKHAVSLGSLRERAEQTDAPLQRLLSAIEKLFDQGGANLANVPAEPSMQDGFQTHTMPFFQDTPAMQSTFDGPLGSDLEGPFEVPDFRKRIALQPETEGTRKPRMPMARII